MNHEHDWQDLKAGFPQRICSCGLIKVKELFIGENTITMSPGGAGDDTMRWSGTGLVNALGEMTMDTTSGRMVMRQDTEARRLRLADEPFPRRKWGFSQDPSTTTVLTMVATTTITTSGTASRLAVAGGDFIDYSSAGQNGWSNTAFDESQPQASPIITAVIRTGSSVADVHFFIGLVAADPIAGTVNGAGIRFNTGAGDTSWTAVNGNGGSITTSATGLAVAANTIYMLRTRVRSTGSSAFGVTNGTSSGFASISGTPPSATTAIGTFVRNSALAGTKAISISHAHISEGPLLT
jgi:hypothetical protein